MKAFILAVLFSAPAFAGSNITLGPGSSAEISAGDTTTVTCSGTAPGNGSLCYCTADSHYTYLYLRLEGGNGPKQLGAWTGTSTNSITYCKRQIKSEFAEVCSQ